MTFSEATPPKPPEHSLKANTHYLYILPVSMGHLYGRYIRMHFFDTHTHGPYIRAVRTGSAYRLL